ncbi:MAG: O-antigen polymerase [Planctomycetota bacterium]|jgi:oligosaccharide repeat unit polymerase
MKKAELARNMGILPNNHSDKILVVLCTAVVCVVAVFVQYKLFVLLACIACYLLSGFLICLSQAGLVIFTPASLFFVFYSVMLLPGSLVLSYRANDFTLAGIVSTGILFFSLGVLVAADFSRFNPHREFRTLAEAPWRDSWRTTPFYVLFFGVILFSLFLALAFLGRHGIPILSQDVEKVRLTAVRSSTYLFPGFRLLLLFGLAVVMIKSQIYTGYWRVLELLLVSAALVLILATGFRAPIAALILYFLLTRQFHRGRLGLRAVFVLGAVFAVIFTALTWKRYSHGFANRTLRDMPRFVCRAVERRIVLNNASNLRFILNFFPDKHEYLYGASFLMDLKAVRPGPDIAFGGWLTAHKRPELAGVVGMTPTVIGEFYANFGLGGVISGMLLFGFAVQSVTAHFVRKGKRVSSIALFVFLTVNLAWAVTSGIGSLVFSRLIPILAVFALLQFSIRAKPLHGLR